MFTIGFAVEDNSDEMPMYFDTLKQLDAWLRRQTFPQEWICSRVVVDRQGTEHWRRI